MKHIITLILFVSVLSCSRDPVSDEQKFKSTVTRLVALLSKNSELVNVSERNPIPNKNTEIVRFDKEKSKKFIQKHKEELINIDYEFSKVSKSESMNKWADDAALCRAIQYSFLFRLNNEIFKKENTVLKEIIIGFQSIEIEHWTKRALGTYYSVFLSSLPNRHKSGLSDTEMIKGGLASFIISELCVDGKYNEAEQELIKLRAHGIHALFINNINSMIKNYRQTKKIK